MFSISALLKFGLSAVFGFLVALLALQIIQPVTENGRTLLIVTTMAATIVVVYVVKAMATFIMKGQAGQ